MFLSFHRILLCMSASRRFTYYYSSVCGSVAKWLGRWTCDQQVAGSNPILSTVECNRGKVVNTHVPLSPSSIIWYQPMGGDALRLMI